LGLDTANGTQQHWRPSFWQRGTVFGSLLSHKTLHSQSTHPPTIAWHTSKRKGYMNQHKYNGFFHWFTVGKKNVNLMDQHHKRAS
jgi:hypothetical protein